jgi:hypothetical protein
LQRKGITPTNPHWARVVGYGLFSLWVIHKEGLCPSSGDINWLLMMMMKGILDRPLRFKRMASIILSVDMVNISYDGLLLIELVIYIRAIMIQNQLKIFDSITYSGARFWNLNNLRIRLS